MIYIYHLLDDEGRVRYVGKSNNPYRRAYEHWRACFGEAHRVYGWIRKWRLRQKFPTVRIVRACAGNGTKCEREEIRAMRAMGHRLLNVNGDGVFRTMADRRRMHEKNYERLRRSQEREDGGAYGRKMDYRIR